MTPVTRSPWGDHSAVSGPSHRFWHQSVATTHHKVPEELDTRGEACGVELTLQGGSGVFTLESSTDLINWSLVRTFPTSGGPVVFVDLSATNRTQTFYRLKWQ